MDKPLKCDTGTLIKLGNVSWCKVATLSAPHLIQDGSSLKKRIDGMLFQGLWGNDVIGLGSCNLKEPGVLLHRHVSLLDTFHALKLEGLD